MSFSIFSAHPSSEADPAAIHMQNYGIYPSGVPPTSTFQCITSNHNRYLADCGDACRGSQEYLIPSGGHLCTIGDSGAGESPQLQWTIQGAHVYPPFPGCSSSGVSSVGYFVLPCPLLVGLVVRKEVNVC